MKAAAAYSLVVHMLITSLAPAGLVEVVRVPALWDHFQVHLVESGGRLTLGEFLVIHYVDAEHETKDHGRHGELPFHNSSISYVLFIPNDTAVALSATSGQVTEFALFKDLWSGQWPGRTVFQPPKGAC